MDEITELIKSLVQLESLRKESPDSLDIGTPGKGGAIKVYGDFGKPEEFRKKVDFALQEREYAMRRMSEPVKEGV